MDNESSLNILHLTDLHIGPEGRPEVYTDRIGSSVGDHPDLKPKNAMENFTDSLKKAVEKETICKPDAILITGDLINKREIMGKGGSSLDQAIIKSFSHAAQGISNLQNAFSLHESNVMVVPGNHDVTWGKDKKFQDRFREFTNATQKWKRPEIANNQVNPVVKDFSDHRIGKKTQIHLFMSPTLSGVEDPSAKKWLDNFKKILKDWSEEDISELIEKIGGESFTPADIAALGTVQKTYIENVVDDKDAVKIAAFHHHLLPDPGIDLGNYESILDAGSVLKSLLEKNFDLVVTGHKHNRVLHKYSSGDKTLDIFSGSSLFFNGNGPGANPGFTMIRIFKDDNPYYAELVHYDNGLKELDSNKLIRDGRVSDELVDCIANVPMGRQTSVIKPLMSNLGDVNGWIADDDELWDVFLEAWKPVSRKVQSMKEKELSFQLPDLAAQWKKLVQYIDDYVDKNKNVPGLRLVSDSDLDYWISAMNNPEYPLSKYETAVREYKNDKTRILLINDEELEHKKIELIKVLKWMKKGGLNVRCVKKAEMKINLEFHDYGLLSNKAVSKFKQEIQGEPKTRYLVENFDSLSLSNYEHQWALLFDDSLDMDVFISSVIEDEVEE